ncbi:MAG: iron-sulfur cluster assembly scaffold protein [Patescibacteria group bacterium]|nr:iron-sulfur cluster assembly scaffold protein [Patescibacteria group bacterium]
MAGKKITEPCGESDVYREEILDHSRNPRNKRKPDQVTFSSRKANMSCGDSINFYVYVGDDSRIEEVGFEGVGCAISMAATSMLTEDVLGKDIEAVLAMGEEDISKLLGAKIGPTRVRCAMLGLETLKRGIEEYRGVRELRRPKTQDTSYR